MNYNFIKIKKMKKPMFDFIDRQIILDYNYKYPIGDYWNKPLIVSQYEITKAKKQFQVQIDKFFFLCLCFINKLFK
jgi:hypothetical protein